MRDIALNEQDLLVLLKNKYNSNDYAIIEQSFYYSKSAHTGQKRKSGEEYFIHPCSVVGILANLDFDRDTLVAAFLHDVLEDTPITAAEISEKFGDEVLLLVEGVTKLDKLKFHNREEEQAENLRKMLFAMAEDIRVLIIKLADRLHNMRTLQYLQEDRRQIFARETMDIFAPLAGRLGISSIKCELEDLCMYYLYPEPYEEIKKNIQLKQNERKFFVDKVSEDIRTKLESLGIKGEVFGRAKHFYSIYKKMIKQSKTVDQIYDLFAVRVIVESIKDCYTVLGTIHTQWKPIPGRFKDFIAVPKPNLYQSLHTTVITNLGATCEIQIRTYEMNRIAEFGVAAHWKYKEGKTENVDKKLRWLKEVVDDHSEIKDNGEFLSLLKFNAFNDEVFVFTPKGDVYNLSLGATPIDFAYLIHSAIGNKCVGAKINNKIVTLNTALKTGDIVEIMTSKNSKGPSRDWLKIVKTSSARNKIRQFFKREEKDENVKRGKEMLEREARHRGYNLNELLAVSKLHNYLSKRYSVHSTEDLYATVGFGGLTTNQIIIKLIDFFQTEMSSKVPQTIIEELEQTVTTIAPIKHRNSGGILINGHDDFSLRLSHCCNPVPGDAIVGYVSRGRGVSVHRKDCPNVKGMEQERLIIADWGTGISNMFSAALTILAEDASGLLASISITISNQGIAITAITAKVDKDNIVIINVVVEVKSLEVLSFLMTKIDSIPAVISVNRSSGQSISNN